ncbi:LamG domain-containing protein [uncultured Bacteroides sp.]|uniref:LamG domain-containing protein n=1 Tax=uncultured Bacteroides sp. TaxID=162156 RepID=UPI002AA884AD|nr:LamG domain-containing protein [uncultured Bacteroides sp.]
MKDSCYVSLAVPSGGYAECAGLNFHPDGSTPFTLESWLHLNGMGSDISVLSRENAFDLSIRNGRLFLSVSGGMALASDVDGTLVDSVDWHHVAVTFDLSFVRFYIDGNIAGCIAAPVAAPENANEWRIGSNLDGRMRCLRTYNTALDASEVLNCLYNAPDTKSMTADVDFSCNPPVNHISPASGISFHQGAAMRLAWPSLLLKGTAYALPSNSTNLNPGGAQVDPYTIHSRIYVTGTYPCMAIMTNGDNNMDSGIALLLVYDRDAKGYHLQALRGSDSDERNWLVSKGVITPDQWASVGCTYDGEHLRIYINGALDSEMEAGPILMSQEQGNVLIGGMLECGRPTGTNTFQGYMARMEIWNIALSDEEMKSCSTTVPEIDVTGLAEAFDFTNVPIRSETSCVAVALCDNARFEELMVPAPETFSEYMPEEISYGVDREWIEQMREGVDLDELKRKRSLLFASDATDGTAELALVLGFEPTAEQRKYLAQRHTDKESNGNLLLGVTHHVVGTDYVLLAHYKKESQVIYRCPVSELDDCTLRIVELVFILIGGMVSAIFGIQTKLTPKSIQYIVGSILPLSSVQAIMSTGSEMKPAQIYLLGKQLSSLGLLKELLKMIVVLGFWALMRFLIKVVLTFLGVGWADTIASLAATAITFGIAYVAYVKNCRPIPMVSIREIRFNHDLNRSDTSAINIRIDAATQVRRPEWVNGQSDPAAYSRAAVNGPVIKARFHIGSLLNYTVNVRAQAVGDVLLGNIPSTQVSFILGNSGEITFQLPNHTIGVAPIGQHNIVWNWQYQDIRTGQWANMIPTNHTIYLTENLPVNPWTQVVGNDTQWPWTRIFDLSLQWMNGAVALPQVKENITNGMYTCGMEYGGGGYLFGVGGGYRFNATQFLADIQNPVNFAVECSECAAIIVLLANIWGSNLIPYSFVNNGHVNTAYIKALGAGAVWETHNFAYHVIATTNNMNQAPNSPVYDGCVAVDASTNPWDAGMVRVPLIPGTANAQMPFGPPTLNVLPVPYQAANNYSDRLFENVPASKNNLNVNAVLPIQII